MTTFIILLRAVNVGGNNRVPMAELKASCEKAGYANVRTYVNSGNVVMEGKGTPASVARAVEAILANSFKVEVPVVVRTAEQWSVYAAKSPFPNGLPKLVHLCLAMVRPPGEAATALLERAHANEQVRVVGDALWIDYADSGVAHSKLTPSAIDKAVGSAATARNWNTVRKLGEMATGIQR